MRNSEACVGGEAQGEPGRGASDTTPVAGMIPQRSGRVVFAVINEDTSEKLGEMLKYAASDEVELIITDEHHPSCVREALHTNGVESAWCS